MSEQENLLIDENENMQTTDNTNDDQTEKTVTSLEDIEPLTYDSLNGMVLNSFVHHEFGHTDQEIYDLFATQFGENFEWSDVLSDVRDERIRTITECVLDEQLYLIQKDGVSLTDTGINDAMDDIMSLVGLNVDLSQLSLSVSKALFSKRAGNIEPLINTFTVLEESRNLYDLYNNGTVSPEINSSVLKMQDLYRDGVIDREILAGYYYGVAMVYEKYSLQKNNSHAIEKEHQRSINFMKKALGKVTQDMGLLLNIRDAISSEPDYRPQDILDACHRVMDNVFDDRSLYLVHKLYAETLTQNNLSHGFSANDFRKSQKIAEHYHAALLHTTSVNDKTDILEALAEHQKHSDKDGYIKTELKLAELSNGRQRIRVLKNLERYVDNENLKKSLLRSAINEFVELDELRSEDRSVYNSLDYKLRQLSKDEPEILKHLDKLKKKYGCAAPKENKEIYFAQISSGGHDLFIKEKSR